MKHDKLVQLTWETRVAIARFYRDVPVGHLTVGELTVLSEAYSILSELSDELLAHKKEC
jgi:hypothetical protein